MRTKTQAILLAILFAQFLLGTVQANSLVNPIIVTGWPLDVNEPQKAVLSNDPIMENLVCPRLTRLNLMASRSEPVLLEKIEHKDKVWNLKLREGLSWWDGSKVSAQDLAAFLRQVLEPRQLNRSRFNWLVPKFDVSIQGQMVTVLWEQNPSFGPYVLNNYPFFTSTKSGFGVQCAGDWVVEAGLNEILLRDKHGKGQNSLLMSSASSSHQSSNLRSISFEFGDELARASGPKPLTQDLVCENRIDTPIMTVIAWNPSSPVAGDPKFRRAMTHLTPRGALLRAGAASMGDLVSGPIVRSHPGYKRGLLVPSYDPAKADLILNELGLRRLHEDGFRRDKQGKSLELKIAVKDYDGSALLRKVLDDSFRALGIKLSFVNTVTADVDGILTGISPSWPGWELSEFLHSQTDASPLPWVYRDRNLDQALEAYALSLTTAAPDFQLLEKVHDLVYKLEPFSVLMQHRVCLKTRLPKTKQRINEVLVRNPDWFRQIIGL